MKMENIFVGNEICCAAYAFVNTVQERSIDYKLFETTSSVSFGIRHRGEKDFSRLLTTYCDPNIGIDRAARLWGYTQEKKLFENEWDFVAYISEKSRKFRCLVGPIDMGNLGYLKFPNLYANLDHYIAIYQKKGQMFLIDSEGIPSRKISIEEMKMWFKANDLPEADGNIAVRTFAAIENLPWKMREEKAVKSSLKYIKENLMEANGSLSVKECLLWLTEHPLNCWKLSFLYDISYLLQRKFLQIYWLNYAEQYVVLRERDVVITRSLILKQIKMLQNILRTMQRRNCICEKQFLQFADLENKLTGIFIS